MSYAKVVKAARRFWDERAKGYSERRTRKDWMRTIDGVVLGLLQVGRDSLVLDVGAGPGIFAANLVKTKLSRVVNLDLSKRFLKIAKDRIENLGLSNRVFFVVASADCLPLRNSSFDGVTSMVAIHHLLPSGIQEAFSEVHRVLKREGKFVLVESWAYKPRNEFQRTMLELRRAVMQTEIGEYHLNYEKYITMLENAGLKVLDVRFEPRPVFLSRFERLTGEKARKLVERAKQFDEKERVVDMTIIHTIKQGNY